MACSKQLTSLTVLAATDYAKLAVLMTLCDSGCLNSSDCCMLDRMQSHAADT